MRLLVSAFAVSLAVGVEVPKQVTPADSLLALIDASPVVTISRCPTDQHILAIYSERDPQWNGRLAVCHRMGDAIDWTFAFPGNYEENRGHYIVRFRWISLRQTSLPVLEVIESTHMGNGSLRIFEADGRKLRLLLDTPVRGRFWSPPAAFGVPPGGEARFEGDHAGIEFRRTGDQAADAIFLTGSIHIEDMKGSALPSRKFEQICVWDATQRVFVARPPEAA